MHTDSILFLPRPQRVTWTGGICRVSPDAARLVEDLTVSHAQGYRLTVSAESITLAAATPVGHAYARHTLAQLSAQFGADLPTVVIDDWPDFPNRGVMLDISRDKVPTLATLTALIDRLAGWKINQLQLYTEHTFAYPGHETVWRDASPLTADDIRTLDAYCRARHIELVPNQNSFGHMHRWLRHPAYRGLAECPDGCDTVWGWMATPFGLHPGPESIAFLGGLYDALLPHFSSRQFNVGCDETVDLGRGRSRERVAHEGEGRVYLDFLRRIHGLVTGHGRTMQFWADIILHHPELVPELPEGVIALLWGYEADHPFDREAALLAQSGVPFYICPGTSSWRTVGGRSANALANLRNAAHNGLAHGAVGYLITDWGDNGHWQPLVVSLLPLAVGAGLAWAVAANGEQDPAHLADRFVFGDDAGVLGRIALDLGNVYRLAGYEPPNASAWFEDALQAAAESMRQSAADHPTITPATLDAATARLDALAARLDDAAPTMPDGDLLQRELAWAIAMLRHATRRWLWVLGDGVDSAELRADAAHLRREFSTLWHARNRPGGFADSVTRFDAMAADYGAPTEADHA